jgi:WhiB family redox-sensing transcriptional regulator
MTAAETFRVALLDVTARGQRAPCEGVYADAWVSESPSERRRAARLCGDCPVITECGAAADETGERWGVWAGRDRTRTPKEKAAS